MNSDVLDVSSFLGLTALVVLTVNFLLGLMLSTAYKRSVYWKRLPARVRKIKVQQVHNWTAYVALGCILLHPGILLLDSATKFFLADILIPFHSDYQTAWTALGTVSFYAVLLVIITTQKAIRRRMGFRLWKNIHLVSYATALLMCVHGIFLDPELKNRTPDFFDGEKLLCEACLVILISASVIRMRYYRKQLIHQHAGIRGRGK
jgi:methionine sulfoxide reductase heme-binding subunit